MYIVVLDQASYDGNVQKLIELFRKSPQSLSPDDGVDLLMKRTFAGRRQE